MGSKITRKALLAGGAAVAVEAAAATAPARAVRSAAAASGIRAMAVAGPLPLTRPGDKRWSKARPVTVPLQPQQILTPSLAKAGVRSLRARALWNGTELGLLLEWTDASADEVAGLFRFNDSVAVMLPRHAVAADDAPPPFTMGAPGAEVQIMQWRASWQHDLERGGGFARRVAEQFPRVVRDLPPSAVLPPAVARLWTPATAVGNPMSAAKPGSAVNEAVAAGFGSTTSVPAPEATGWGVHTGRGWKVAIGFPAGRGGIGDEIVPGSSWPVSFAVWLGSQKNRGARKHWADWVTLKVPARSAS